MAHNILIILLYGVWAATLTAVYSSTDGQCVCHVHSNPTYDDFMEIRSSLAKLGSRLEALENLRLGHKVKHLGQRLKVMSENLHNQSILVSITELWDLQNSYDVLASEMNESNADNQTQAMRSQAEKLNETIAVLWDKNPASKAIELQEEVEALEKKVTMYEEQTFSGSVFSFPGDNAPLAMEYDKDWCLAYEIDVIGEPVIHKYDSKQTQWMKDPKPLSLESRSYIFVGKPYSYDYWDWLYYNSYSDFLIKSNPDRATSQSRSRYYSYSNQVNWYSYAIYGGAAYNYDDYKVNKYKMRSSTSGPILDSSFNIGTVSSNYKYIDTDRQSTSTYQAELMVDELGLWVVYTTENSAGRLTITKLDDNLTTVGETHVTYKLRSSVCKSFMACGKLYTLQHCSRPLYRGSVPPQYVYNTTDHKEYSQPLFARSLFGKITSLLYNPRERMLFGVDNNHLVTYPIKWRRIKS